MRVLPALVILSAPLWLMPGTARAEMDRNACRLAAEQEEILTGLLRKHVQGVEGVSDPVALKHSARPDLRETARRAAAAHAAYLASARDYIAATEDMAHGYRVCSR